MNVEFCNSTAFKVESSKLIENVFVECDRLLKTNLPRDSFPGPQPVTVEKKNFEMLKTEPYMICEKSDGERYVLLLINITNKPMCFLINRNNDFYFININFTKEVFEGSIFDGELIKTKSGSWNYLIHDCMCYNGESFINKPHNIRYQCIIDLIVKRYVNKPTDPFNVKTKLFYTFGPEIHKTWEHIKSTTDNKIDGLIFTPVDHPITFKRDYKLLKWKESCDHTMDLLVKKSGKKFHLHGSDKKDLYVFKTIDHKDPSYQLIVDFLEKNNSRSYGHLIVEFRYSIDDELFTPCRLRTDKSFPNGKITIENTIKNIEEAIGINDFFAIVSEPELDLSKLVVSEPEPVVEKKKKATVSKGSRWILNP